ncbi:MAG: hypothetical protein QXX74_02915 [Candidatus Micrarchaeaceae archaeon]
MSLESEKIGGLRLLEKVVEKGKVVSRGEGLKEIRIRAQRNLEMLPDIYKNLNNAVAYPIELSPRLLERKNRLRRKMDRRMRTK